MSLTTIFVYGSLKRGYWNHDRCDLDKATYLGKALTVGRFDLYDLGAFPGITVGDTSQVAGEVYQVDRATFIPIDSMERGAGYQLTPVRVTIGDKEIEANMWLYRYTLHGNLLKGGVWDPDNLG